MPPWRSVVRVKERAHRTPLKWDKKCRGGVLLCDVKESARVPLCALRKERTGRRGILVQRKDAAVAFRCAR